MGREFASGLKPLPALDPRSARTRETLRHALLRLLKQKALEQVTVRDLAAQAAIGYATFFRHYPDKAALLSDIASEEIGKLLALTWPLLFTADTRAAARALCTHVWEQRGLWTVLFTGGAAAILKQEFVCQAQALTVKAEDAYGVVPTNLRTIFCISGTLELLVWWLAQEEPISVCRVADILDMLLVAPHAPPKSETLIAGPAGHSEAR